MMTEFAKNPICFKLLRGKIKLRGIFVNLLSWQSQDQPDLGCPQWPELTLIMNGPGYSGAG